MPVATHTLSGDFSGLVGEVSSIRATVTTNSTDGGWVNDVDNVIVLGAAVLAVGADGKFTVTLPTSTSTGLQYQVTALFTYGSPDPKTWDSGWFTLTANADLADLANNSSLRVTQTLGDQLAARIDGYQDHGDVSGVLTIDPAIGTHVLNATGSLLVTLDAAPDGRIVTLYIVGGASNVTVDGISDLTLTDGSFASFVHIRGAWVLASAGGATGPADTTPPSAVTDLAVTPGSDGVTATATFTPATDAESTVKYRYRIYATGSTAPAWPTSGPQYNLAGSPIALTGLTAGTAYTMDLQAYSAGGSAAADTATFTTPVPAGWNTIASDNFTGTDGQSLYSRPTTTGGLSWTGTGAPIISSNKVALTAPDSTATATLAFPSASTATGVEFLVDYFLLDQLDSALATVKISLADSPDVTLQRIDNDDLKIRITGYDTTPSPGYQFGSTVVAPYTGTPTTGQSGTIGVRRVGNTLSVIDGAGNVLVSADLSTAWTGYKDKPTPTTATVFFGSFQRSTLDNLVVRTLT